MFSDSQAADFDFHVNICVCALYIKSNQMHFLLKMLGEISINRSVKYQISGLDLSVKYIMIDLLLSITVYTVYIHIDICCSRQSILRLFLRFMYQSYNLIEEQS